MSHFCLYGLLAGYLLPPADCIGQSAQFFCLYGLQTGWILPPVGSIGQSECEFRVDWVHLLTAGAWVLRGSGGSGYVLIIGVGLLLNWGLGWLGRFILPYAVALESILLLLGAD